MENAEVPAPPPAELPIPARAAEVPAPPPAEVEAPRPPAEVAEASPSPPVPPNMDSTIPGFMVDCHGEKWFEDPAATMRDINGPYHYRSWSLKTPTDTTWIDGYNVDKKKIPAGYVFNDVSTKAAYFDCNLYQSRTGRSEKKENN